MNAHLERTSVLTMLPVSTHVVHTSALAMPALPITVVSARTLMNVLVITTAMSMPCVKIALETLAAPVTTDTKAMATSVTISMNANLAVLVRLTLIASIVMALILVSVQVDTKKSTVHVLILTNALMVLPPVTKTPLVATFQVVTSAHAILDTLVPVTCVTTSTNAKKALIIAVPIPHVATNKVVLSASVIQASS
jgi:hypothetical protein